MINHHISKTKEGENKNEKEREIVGDEKTPKKIKRRRITKNQSPAAGVDPYPSTLRLLPEM